MLLIPAFSWLQVVVCVVIFFIIKISMFLYKKKEIRDNNRFMMFVADRIGSDNAVVDGVTGSNIPKWMYARMYWLMQINDANLAGEPEKLLEILKKYDAFVYDRSVAHYKQYYNKYDSAIMADWLQSIERKTIMVYLELLHIGDLDR